MTTPITATETDEQLLAQMVDAGSDLNKRHYPEFLFDVQNKNDIDALADELEALSFDVFIYEPEADGELFQVVARCEMELNLDNLQKMRVEFEQLAQKHHAVYDGWGADVVE